MKRIVFLIFLVLKCMLASNLEMLEFGEEVPPKVLLKGSNDDCIITFDSSKMVAHTDCLRLVDSRNNKIFCTKKSKICKTEEEIAKYAEEAIYTARVNIYNEENKEEIVQDSTKEGLIIKGFSLDMKFEDACNKISKVGDNKQRKYIIKTIGDMTICGFTAYNWTTTGHAGSYITKDKDNNIQKIYLATFTINTLFKSSSMDAYEFAEAFFPSYDMHNVKWKKNRVKLSYGFIDKYSYVYKNFIKRTGVRFFGIIGLRNWGMDYYSEIKSITISRLEETPIFD